MESCQGDNREQTEGGKTYIGVLGTIFISVRRTLLKKEYLSPWVGRRRGRGKGRRGYVISYKMTCTSSHLSYLSHLDWGR